jgi:hypothetical protein
MCTHWCTECVRQGKLCRLPSASPDRGGKIIPHSSLVDGTESKKRGSADITRSTNHEVVDLVEEEDEPIESTPARRTAPRFAAPSELSESQRRLNAFLKIPRFSTM